MGDVSVRIKLTNAVDEGLAREGRLAEDKVRFVDVDAIVDTGAVRSAIPAEVLEELGLPLSSTQDAIYPDGRREEVSIAGPLIVDIMARRTMEDVLVLGDEVLVGQTILEKLDLLVDCRNQRLIPNPDHPDGAVTKIRA